MTEHKLLKYIGRRFEPPTGEKLLTPIVRTDSKGKYILRQSIENNIKWWFQSGRTSGQGLDWLRENLEAKIGHLDNISLYVWLGTCDLTEYNFPYITLRSNTSELVQKIVENFQEIPEILQKYPGYKLTFLEIPHYSIYKWNKSHKHPDINKCLAEDDTLANHVAEINDHISYINNNLNTRSSGVSLDILHRSNSKKKHKSAKDQYNYQLYLDEIPPSRNLARVWLRKISLKVKIDCW